MFVIEAVSPPVTATPLSLTVTLWETPRLPLTRSRQATVVVSPPSASLSNTSNGEVKIARPASAAVTVCVINVTPGDTGTESANPLEINVVGPAESPVAPVGPVAPVAPVAPVGPVAPVAPVAPVGPVWLQS